jgi:hypothetical protein
VPVAPTRFLDTRSGVGGAPIPVTGEGFVDLKVAGTRGVPAEATAAVLNLTGTASPPAPTCAPTPVGAARCRRSATSTWPRRHPRQPGDRQDRHRRAGPRPQRRRAVNLIGDLAGYMIG